MTIEELAIQSDGRKLSQRGQCTYDNIRKMRNASLMRSFLCRGGGTKPDKIATIAGVDYVDATSLRTLNQAWLMFERSTKNIIWILKINGLLPQNISLLKDTLQRRIRNIILVYDGTMIEKETVDRWSGSLNNIVHIDKADNLRQALTLAKSTALTDDRIVFMELDAKNIADVDRDSAEFSDIVFSM